MKIKSHTFKCRIKGEGNDRIYEPLYTSDIETKVMRTIDNNLGNIPRVA